jgi:hypothetical protein
MDRREVRALRTRRQGGKRHDMAQGLSHNKLSYKYSFMKGIMLAYARFFYSEQRRKYIDKWRRNVDIIERELRAQLGIR